MSGITGELSEQRIFDYVAAHLLKQGHAAMGTSSKGMCRYLTQDGSKCAVGCLLAEEEYDEIKEGKTVKDLARDGTLPIRFVPYLHLLSHLQHRHDYDLATKGVSAWVENMVILARSEGLSAEVLNVQSAVASQN